MAGLQTPNFFTPKESKVSSFGDFHRPSQAARSNLEVDADSPHSTLELQQERIFVSTFEETSVKLSNGKTLRVQSLAYDVQQAVLQLQAFLKGFLWYQKGCRDM